MSQDRQYMLIYVVDKWEKTYSDSKLNKAWKSFYAEFQVEKITSSVQTKKKALVSACRE